jgi:hypothetical protein
LLVGFWCFAAEMVMIWLWYDAQYEESELSNYSRKKRGGKQLDYVKLITPHSMHMQLANKQM